MAPLLLFEPTTYFLLVKSLQLATRFSRLRSHSSSVSTRNCSIIFLVYSSSILRLQVDCCSLMMWSFFPYKSLKMFWQVSWYCSWKVESGRGSCPFFARRLFSLSLQNSVLSLASCMIRRQTLRLSGSQSVLWACSTACQASFARGSLHLSGCRIIANVLYCFLISSSVAAASSCSTSQGLQNFSLVSRSISTSAFSAFALMDLYLIASISRVQSEICWRVLSYSFILFQILQTGKYQVSHGQLMFRQRLRLEIYYFERQRQKRVCLRLFQYRTTSSYQDHMRWSRPVVKQSSSRLKSPENRCSNLSNSLTGLRTKLEQRMIVLLRLASSQKGPYLLPFFFSSSSSITTLSMIQSVQSTSKSNSSSMQMRILLNRKDAKPTAPNRQTHLQMAQISSSLNSRMKEQYLSLMLHASRSSKPSRSIRMNAQKSGCLLQLASQTRMMMSSCRWQGAEAEAGKKGVVPWMAEQRQSQTVK